MLWFELSPFHRRIAKNQGGSYELVGRGWMSSHGHNMLLLCQFCEVLHKQVANLTFLLIGESQYKSQILSSLRSGPPKTKPEIVGNLQIPFEYVGIQAKSTRIPGFTACSCDQSSLSANSVLPTGRSSF